MQTRFLSHNRFWVSQEAFETGDPQLFALSQLKIRHSADWWSEMTLSEPGIYILTGGRQIGKSTSCKLLIKHVLQKALFLSQQIFYLPCDEIFDAKELSETIRAFLNEVQTGPFLLIIDEVTFVPEWDRVIKSLADEGAFHRGICLLTGSDTLILKEAAMRFPGRRGRSKHTDFHIYPLSFRDYVQLITKEKEPDNTKLAHLFDKYLVCGGYLRAINDLEENGEVADSTLLTYEQWIRGDFLKRGKKEELLVQLLRALLTVGVSHISYSSLTQKIGLMTNETCMDYCQLLNRMDVLLDLQAYDPDKQIGFPRKARKFHFSDPFIYRTLVRWLQNEGFLHTYEFNSTLVEACVASHCSHLGQTFYFKGTGEVDVIWLQNRKVKAIEVKWSNTLKPADVKLLKQFPDKVILQKAAEEGMLDGVLCLPVYRFLYDIKSDASPNEGAYRFLCE